MMTSLTLRSRSTTYNTSTSHLANDTHIIYTVASRYQLKTSRFSTGVQNGRNPTECNAHPHTLQPCDSDRSPSGPKACSQITVGSTMANVPNSSTTASIVSNSLCTKTDWQTDRSHVTLNPLYNLHCLGVSKQWMTVSLTSLMYAASPLQTPQKHL